MKIAIDAMGGDFAPASVIEGVLNFTADADLLLVGPKARLRALLDSSATNGSRHIEIVDATDVIAMDDNPVKAIRGKPNSSLVRCTDLLRDGEVQAIVSAGNTGAALAAGLLMLGRIPGIDRPAITCTLPNRRGQTVLLDAGANVDVGPENLLQFAIMGNIYAREILGIQRPRVGLLNIGEEPTKGTETVRRAYALLKEAPLDFIGNVEGPDLFNASCDVAVCDGFVGNVVLKVGEGVAEFLRHLLKEEMGSHPFLKIPALMLGPALRRIARRTDYREVGGAPLLGIKGVSIISHGRSNAVAIGNAIQTACRAVNHGIIDKIRTQISS